MLIFQAGVSFRRGWSHHPLPLSCSVLWIAAVRQLHSQLCEYMHLWDPDNVFHVLLQTFWDKIFLTSQLCRKQTVQNDCLEHSKFYGTGLKCAINYDYSLIWLFSSLCKIMPYGFDRKSFTAGLDVLSHGVQQGTQSSGGVVWDDLDLGKSLCTSWSGDRVTKTALIGFWSQTNFPPPACDSAFWCLEGKGRQADRRCLF